ncbi:MAG: ABC transporter permease [Anaerolineales bacterium]|nr:ABC transporter permease [Anaerolineales bacterium]
MKSFIRNWGIYLLKRVGSLLIALLVISFVTFVIVRQAGTPVYLMVGDDYTQEMIDSANARLGLDKPFHIQYLNYLNGIVHGNLGVSRFTFNPVTFDIAQRLPATVELATVALIMMILWGIPAGIVAALKEGTPIDKAILVVPKAGVSATQFWFGLLLIFVFYYLLDWFPEPSGRLPYSATLPPRVTGMITVDCLLIGDFETFKMALHRIILPAFSLAFTISPGTLLVTRATLRNILKTDYYRTARAFGLPKSKLYFKYMFRNAFSPILTVLAVAYGSFIGGTVFAEVVFTWPGIGRYAVDALQRSDFEPIVGLVLLSSVTFAIVYFFTDVICAIVDPRYRLT